MPGKIKTEKGLGDGIEFLFKPFLDLANDGAEDADNPIEFPTAAKNILNAFFSGAVLSSFEEKACAGESGDGSIGFNEALGVGSNAQWIERANQMASIEPNTLSALSKVTESLSAKERAAVWKAIGAKDPKQKTRKKNVESEKAVLLDPESFAATTDGICYAHTGTDGFVSRGFQSGEVGFELKAGTVDIGINLTFESRVTIVGQEPIIERKQPEQGADDFVPLGRTFKIDGEVRGMKQLTMGGKCAPPRCNDEWVSGVAKITTIAGMKARLDSNLPDRLRDVLPGLGVGAGIQTTIVYTFPFHHYPRTAPQNVPGSE